MRLADVLPGAHLAPEHRDREIAGLASDSRAVERGFAFFAVPGTKQDGLAFVPEALAKGAAAVVAESAPAHLPVDVALALVPAIRPALAEAAARFSGAQPETVVAVTGTSGKTSVAAFVRQIWLSEGLAAASLGTLGVVGPRGDVYGSLTTPDPVTLHRTLADLAADGVSHLALEASSHGLDQHRLDGVALSAGAFTNLSRDHLDYHPDAEHYLSAKLRLFEALLAPGQPAVIDADGEVSARVVAAAEARGLAVFTVGRGGESLRLEEARPDGFATRLAVVHDGERYDIRLPLAGTFQVSNALVAAGLCLSTGSHPDAVFTALERLVGAPGRLELVGERRGAPVFVDYAHKPDALENALATLRPYAKGRLVVVFGCGGDRDPGKRPLMGEIASRLADVAIVTDDNPRSEDPAAIRAAILDAAPGAREIGDRAAAIRAGVALLGPGDVLLIAGKGHETGQIVGGRTLPFSDHEVATAALWTPETAAERPLWSGLGLVAPLGARVGGRLPSGVGGVSIDSRTIKPGELYVAIRGESKDGHDFVGAAFEAGAAAAVVDEDHAGGLAGSPCLLVVHDTLASLESLGAAARARSGARIVAVTGSVGKTSTKEALRVVMGDAGETHASVASFNNHWGVPLTLARLPASALFGVFEIGMNHPGEITPLVGLVRPHIALVTTVAAVHLEHFSGVEEIADAKAEIFSGLVEGGTAIIHRDIPTFERLRVAAEASPAGEILSFGEHPEADARLEAIEATADGSLIAARVGGERIEFRLGSPGRHLAVNALGILLAARAAGIGLEEAAASLGRVTPGAGRGERSTLQAPTGAFTLIDESYNANPTSMRAALALLGATPPGPGGRRIAVIGDMRELGPDGAAMHGALAPEIEAGNIDLVFAAGPLSHALFSAVPAGRRGLWGANAAAIQGPLAEALRGGDVVMIKGSNGSRLGPVVAALKERFRGAPPAS